MKKIKKRTKSRKYKKLKQIKKENITYIVLAVIIIISASLLATLVALSTNHAIPLSFDGDKLSGIDISSHNGDVEWDKVKNNIDFAFIRVGYRGYEGGTINEDKNAQTNLRHANKNKIPVGVYFYSQATTEQEAIEEAEFALDMVKWHDISLPIIIDFEYPQDKNGKMIGRLHEADLGNEDRTNIINAFCKTIKDAGYEYGVYASTSVFKNQLNTKDFLPNTLIWVAHYSDNLKYTKDVDIWQYSKTGQMDGVPSKYVDLNYWFCDELKND